MERRKFTREFKLEAVRLIKERGVSYAQASLDLVERSRSQGLLAARSRQERLAPLATTIPLGRFGRAQEIKRIYARLNATPPGSVSMRMGVVN